MSVSKTSLVRLIGAVTGATATVWFIETYTRISRFRFDFEHDNHGPLIGFIQLQLEYGNWLYLLPVAALAAGVWLLWRRPTALTAFEVVLSTIWLVSLGLAGLCILVWQAQNMPTFSHMEWHY